MNLIQFAEKLKNFNNISLYFTGGYVRDKLLKKCPLDYDICSSMLPDDLIKFCRNHNIKFIETAKKYGTVSIIFNNNVYEHTTLREDIKTFGRKAEVSFSNSLKKDSLRRDFTINALYMNILTGKIIDFHNGLKDLKNNRLLFIGNPEHRIKEDFLRIIRFFRFLNNTEFSYNQADFISVNKLIKGIDILSFQRLKNEFLKIFKCGLSSRYKSIIIDFIFKASHYHPFFKIISPAFSDNNINHFENLLFKVNSIPLNNRKDFFYWFLILIFFKNERVFNRKEKILDLDNKTMNLFYFYQSFICLLKNSNNKEVLWNFYNNYKNLFEDYFNLLQPFILALQDNDLYIEAKEKIFEINAKYKKINKKEIFNKYQISEAKNKIKKMCLT
ncbi:MAG: hypothetical protein ACQESP_10080 [Candidatus Muiribacteriota bacterium]